MSKVVEYVGFFHILKDNIKEAWTQFWVNFSSPSGQPEGEIAANGSGGGGDGEVQKEINLRSKVKARLDKLKQQTISAIDKSSDDQDDFSHLTRSKTRKELMQISAAVMGIEFSYAAETAFVSPLLLNIGLRHRHMTLIWCLSPLLGFFLTPILGSLSDGCRSQLGRRRPFIILLSIGIILGLILVPNGKAIGRLLGDTYADDKLPQPGDKSSELAAHLLLLNGDRGNPEIPANYSISTSTTEMNIITTSPSPEQEDESELEMESSNENENERIASKKHYFFSKYNPSEIEHGFRARNSLLHKDRDLDRQEFLKNLAKDKSRKINQEELQHAIEQATNSRRRDDKIENGTVTVSRSKRSTEVEPEQESKSNFDSGSEDAVKSHPWGLVFTVIGTVLLDFDADACQSPSRAYMLDVTIPDDHAKGLSTFTIMAGLGGSIGYFLGALNWENTFLGQLFGGHVRAVFTLVLFIFIACVIATIRSFREIPVDRLWANKSGGMGSQSSEPKPMVNPNPHFTNKSYARLDDDGYDPESKSDNFNQKSYGAMQETSFNNASGAQSIDPTSSSAMEQAPTFREYVKTIVLLPRSLQWLCLTNFFCWMSLVCYSLYFTDFVGEAVFGGDPTAPRDSPLKEKYDEGVRFGCWGMSLYSLSCSLYSLCIEQLVNRFGARRVYIYGQLVYSVGMVCMAISRHPAGVIIFSWTAGIMYATLFTMPYLLVARYHAAETFDVDVDDLMEKPPQMRGLGTDVAIVSSMVFLAQITQALTLGTVVTIVGSTTAIICAAALFAACGAVCATKVLYLDL